MTSPKREGKHIKRGRPRRQKKRERTEDEQVKLRRLTILGRGAKNVSAVIFTSRGLQSCLSPGVFVVLFNLCFFIFCCCCLEQTLSSETVSPLLSRSYHHHHHHHHRPPRWSRPQPGPGVCVCRVTVLWATLFLFICVAYHTIAVITGENCLGPLPFPPGNTRDNNK